MEKNKRLTNEELTAIRERAEKATRGNPLIDATTLAKMNIVIIEDIPKLLAEIDRLRESVEMSKRIVGNLTWENAILKGENPITVHLNGGDSE